ncbi:MAG: rRNA pseudouridine synthase [Ruminococcaceae bacterium]|nr:rRNA pseudouridine synthase [Oscillospiraceae bacterium]
MRLDKLLGITGCCSRTEAKKLIRSGAVTVNGIAAASADQKVEPQQDTVIFCGTPVVYRQYTYIVLNKPEGVVSATEDGKDRTVLDLLPADMRRAGLFPCGRLDKNTVGLVLITDNGALAHRLLAPKSHVEKEYRFRSKFPLTPSDVDLFEQGVVLEDGYETKPARLFLEPSGDAGRIVLVEGKYHQIKRMLEALHNKITHLERIRFGPLTLDGIPNRGDLRYLTETEIAALESHEA